MPPDNDVQHEIEQLEQRFAENSQGLVFAHLADAYRRAGEFAKAEGLILHGLKTHPTYISAYNVLGRIYLDSERFADAHEQFNKVLELDPQNLIALRALGDLALQGGRFEDARSWYERILQIDPRNEEAQEALKQFESGSPDSPAPAGEETGAAGETEATGEATPPLELEEPTPPGADDEIEKAFDMMQGENAAELGDLDIEAPAIEPSRHEPAEEEPIGEVEPVEGLVNKETMTQSRDEVDHDPEVVEGAARLTSEEVAGGEEMPWEGLTELESLEPEASAADDQPESDAFSDSMVEGLSPDAPDGEEGGRARSEFDLQEMGDWTPGYLHEKDLTAERGEELGADALMDEAAEIDLEFAGRTEADADQEAESEADEGVVTETMAELYAKQGLYDDALGVYRKLADARPDDEGLKQKIAELESKLEESAGEHAPGLELSELLELTEPRVPAEFDSDTTTPVEPEGRVEPPATEATPAEAEPAVTPEFLTVDEQAPDEAPAAEPEVGAPTAEAAATDATEFAFADEAPLAGIEQLDPFASSFDVFVQRDGATEEKEEPAEIETTAPGFEGPVPVTVEGVPLVEQEPDLVPPGAYIEPPPPTPPPPSRQPPAEPEAFEPVAEPARTAPASTDSLTIEDYLAGLLAYSPGSSRAAPPGSAERSAPASEPAPDPSPSPPADASPPTGGDDDDDEDLEQFQEWLRGLKT